MQRHLLSLCATIFLNVVQSYILFYDKSIFSKCMYYYMEWHAVFRMEESRSFFICSTVASRVPDMDNDGPSDKPGMKQSADARASWA